MAIGKNSALASTPNKLVVKLSLQIRVLLHAKHRKTKANARQKVNFRHKETANLLVADKRVDTTERLLVIGWF